MIRIVTDKSTLMAGPEVDEEIETGSDNYPVANRDWDED